MLLRLLLHALSLALPLTTLAWLAAMPWLGWEGLVWFLLVVACVAVDLRASPERRQPDGVLPPAVYDGTLAALGALQVVNVSLLVARAAELGLGDPRVLLAQFLVGLSSGYSAIVVAHELVHRRGRGRLLGRALLVTVLYEHFATEHVRGHHARIGTAEDPATARHGEGLGPFLGRTVVGQLRSAWRIEAERLGRPRWWSLRWVESEVVQGLLVQAALVGLVFLLGGLAAGAAFLYQASLAVLLLECVNYVEHWGLRRSGRRATTVDSWDTTSWFSYYSLVGLTRHADHHAHAARPYQDLRYVEESPKMPHGYWGMVLRAIFDNRRLRQALDEELKRKALGPYRRAESFPSA